LSPQFSNLREIIVEFGGASEDETDLRSGAEGIKASLSKSSKCSSDVVAGLEFVDWFTFEVEVEVEMSSSSI